MLPILIATRTRPPRRRRPQRIRATTTFWILLGLLLLELLAAMIDPQSGILYFPKWASQIQDDNNRRLLYHQVEQMLSLATNWSQPEALPFGMATKYKFDFDGIVPRSFAAWPENQTLPCFPPDENVFLKLGKTKGRDKNTSTHTDVVAKQGFFFLKPFKVGSSTAAGVNLRIARGVAMRQQRRLQKLSSLQQDSMVPHPQQDQEQPEQQLPIEFCNARFDHGNWQRPGLRFAQRNRNNESFLWTLVREPTTRLVSMFFHFYVSRRQLEPSDTVFQAFLQDKRLMHHDYYIRALDTSEDPIIIFNNTITATNTTSSEGKLIVQKNPIETANLILKDFDFIGVTERMDESFVALMMILHLPMSDILYLSAKRNGGYDAGHGKGANRTCTLIRPSFVSPGMQDYFASTVHQEMIKHDLAFYRAVNQSLDMTIDRLGRLDFEKNLAQYRMASTLIQERCADSVVRPCTDSGVYIEHNKTDCLWKDSGCATTCLDEIAQELAME